MIDSHLHVRDEDTLDKFTKWGVPAVIDLGCWPVSLVTRLQEHSNKVSSNIPIIAGTDANSSPMASVAHGESIHRGLELLIAAGMSPLAALQAAKVEPAEYFGFNSGVIEPGRPANLVLLGRTPLKILEQHAIFAWFGVEVLEFLILST